MDVASFTYGSDQSGLIWGYVFAPDAPPAAIGTHEAAAWLEARDHRPASEFVWLHFNLSNTASEKWIHEHAGVAEEF